jgi:phosphoribosylpyrophosphate synthetase
LIRAASALRAAGADLVQVAFTHAPYLPGLQSLAAAVDIDAIVTTDSTGSVPRQAAAELGERIAVLGIAPLFGAALARMFSHRPVSVLLERFPARDAE